MRGGRLPAIGGDNGRRNGVRRERGASVDSLPSCAQGMGGERRVSTHLCARCFLFLPSSSSFPTARCFLSSRSSCSLGPSRVLRSMQCGRSGRACEGKHVVGAQNKEDGESGRRGRGEAGRRREESEMRSARQRLGRRSYSRARARSASKPLLRARSSLLSSPSLSSFPSSPSAFLLTMAPSLACWVEN